MKPRKTLSIYVLLIGVMGLSIVGGVLAFQIFSASVKSQLTTAQKEAVRPIDGTIVQPVVDNLQKRSVITESELGSVLTPAPTVEPLDGQATPSGEPIIQTQ